MEKVNRPEIKQAARQAIKGNIGIYFLTLIIYILLDAAVQFVPFAGAIGTIICTGPFMMSFQIMSLKMGRDQKIEVSDLFSGFKMFGKSILLCLVMSIFIILWSLLLVIPGIIAAYRYSMAFYILYDNPEIGVMEALKRSKVMMKGRKWELFVFELSFIGWCLLGFVTFGLIYIYVAPYIAAANGKFYDAIKGNTPAAPEAPAPEAPVIEEKPAEEKAPEAPSAE